MKSFSFLTAILLACVLAGCQKQQTEAERNAEIERQVQARLAAEKQAQDQQDLSARVANLEGQQKEGEEPQTQTDTTSTRSDDDQRSSASERREREPSGGRDDEEGGYGMFYR